MLNGGAPLDGLTAADIMSPHPKTIADSEYAVAALHLMRTHSITQLIVTDANGCYLGIVHLHDILREGII
jgi:arabinose-5-phosphate isomerase